MQFLRMLSEEENGSSSSNESELALEKVVDAAASCYEVAGRGRSRSTLGIPLICLSDLIVMCLFLRKHSVCVINGWIFSVSL